MSMLLWSSNGLQAAESLFNDCPTVIANNLDICAEINNDLSHPLAGLDCDEGGKTNIEECLLGGDPLDPFDDVACVTEECAFVALNNLDICVLLANDPTLPIATLDCDSGGVDNLTECNNNGDPSDPSDDCLSAELDPSIEVCLLIAGQPTHPLAQIDCDGGGVTNYLECSGGNDPFDPTDDCTAATSQGLLICSIISPNGSYDPLHPMAILDCDSGGIDNLTECENGGDPADPNDDCAVVAAAGLDLCVLIDSSPTLSQADCDGDGVSNFNECGATDPYDPCSYIVANVTLPVTADQSNCEEPCPDLSPVITVVPGNIQGVASVGVSVEVFELNMLETDGSSIIVRIPSDPRLTFSWDPSLTSVAFNTVNNNNWQYLGDNGVVHTFSFINVLAAGGLTAFGFEASYDPQSTDGQTTITSTIIPFNGGECVILNNTDAERLVYFE